MSIYNKFSFGKEKDSEAKDNFDSLENGVHFRYNFTLLKYQSVQRETSYLKS